MSQQDWRQSPAQRPDPVGQLFALALQRHKAGQFAEAERLYLEVLAVDPKHIDSLHLAGVAAHQSGRSDGAIERIERALELAGPVSTFHNSLGEALRGLNRHDEAVEQFRQALALEPEFFGAHLNLGSALKQQGKLADAVTQYKWVLALKPDFAEAHANLGIALMDQNDLAGAEHHLREALRIAPNLIQAQMNLGIVAQRQHKLDDAIAHYERALTIDQRYVLALINLGDALFDRGRIDEAAGRYARALRLTTRPAETAADLLDPVEAIERMSMTGRPLYQVEDKCVMGLVRLACWKSEPAEWPRPSAAALALPGMTAASRYELQVRTAIGQWMARDEAGLASTLDACAALNGEIEFSNTNVTNSRAYAGYLRNLLAHAQASPGLRSPAGAHPVAAVIGDSHVLAYDGAELKLDGMAHTASAKLVMGCKAFHLTQDQPNRFTWLFEKIVRELPAGTPMMLSFGEIDCRLNDGILPHSRKVGADPEQLAGTLAQRYVAAVLQLVGARSPTPAFLGVPAPNFALLEQAAGSAIPQDERAALVRVVSAFNASLAGAAAAAGCRFVDLYAVSSEADGGAAGPLHLDDHHLRPDALARALE